MTPCKRCGELEAALEELRPHKPHEDLCADNFDEGPCDCTFGAKNRVIDTALSAPAQPAMATKEECRAWRQAGEEEFVVTGEPCDCSTCKQLDAHMDVAPPSPATPQLAMAEEEGFHCLGCGAHVAEPCICPATPPKEPTP